MQNVPRVTHGKELCNYSLHNLAGNVRALATILGRIYAKLRMGINLLITATLLVNIIISGSV